MARDAVLGGAILAGCCVIGLGVYFGLRERPVVVVSPGGSSETADVAPPLERTRLPTPVEDPDLSASAEARGVEAPKGPAAPPSPDQLEASRALDATKPALRKACWDPILEKRPTPSQAEFTYDLAFDADGKQVGRGISEPAGTSRSDVARCLGKQPLDLTLSPPGHMVQVRVTLSLP